MEIAPGIHLIPGSVAGRPLNLFLLRGADRIVLVDTGCAPDPERLIVPYLAGLGLEPSDISLVITSHADVDHCGGNAAFRRLSPSTLLTCGEADRALVEDPQQLYACRHDGLAQADGLAEAAGTREWMLEMMGAAQPVDFTWRGGESLRLGPDWSVEMRATPGHTAGHLAVYDPRSHTLLSADAVRGAGYPTQDGCQALAPGYRDVAAYRQTLAAMRGWDIQTLASSHWPVCHGTADIAAFLDESQAQLEQAGRALLAALAGQPDGLSLAELIAAVGPEMGNWPRTADQELRFALAGNLEHLAAQGRVTADHSAQPAHYRLPQAQRARQARRLDGRVAIVTGAGRGIGAAIATRFAEEGARVVIAELDPATGEATAAQLRQAGYAALAVPTDVGDPDSIQRMVDATIAHFGP
ncbi:MAG: SDR family NAD(P)-dependent oxidoreductase, partial [Anaerolineales bacterium]